MKKILIVDDNEHIREVSVDMLSLFVPNQFQFFTAKNGKEGLDILLKEQNFYALITDFNMPEMTGHELLVEIIKRDISLERIIVISGNPKNEILISALDHGNYKINFLAKPFQSQSLIALIK